LSFLSQRSRTALSASQASSNESPCFALAHPESARFKQVVVLGLRKKEHQRGDTRYADQLLRMAYHYEALPPLSSETAERYLIPESTAVPVQCRGLPLDAIEDEVARSGAMENALNLLVRKEKRIEGRPVTPLHGGHGLLCTAGMRKGVFSE